MDSQHKTRRQAVSFCLFKSRRKRGGQLTCKYSDQLIKRRGKAGLLLLNADWQAAKAWIEERAGKETKVESTVGRLSSFIVEPFLPHPAHTEFYVCINSAREGDHILFTHEGGIEVGDVDAKALKLLVPVDGDLPSREEIKKTLLKDVPAAKQDVLVDFLIRLYSVYVDLHFAYLEINPLICLDGTDTQPPSIHYLDMAAKLDQTAEYLCGPKWAIARDRSTYDDKAAAVPVTKIQTDRGPPMGAGFLTFVFFPWTHVVDVGPLWQSSPLLSAVT
jgi:ATP citrate (pro-S)-lyase